MVSEVVVLVKLVVVRVTVAKDVTVTFVVVVASTELRMSQVLASLLSFPPTLGNAKDKINLRISSGLTRRGGSSLDAAGGQDGSGHRTGDRGTSNGLSRRSGDNHRRQQATSL